MAHATAHARINNRMNNRADIFHPYLQPTAEGITIHWLTALEWSEKCSGIDKRHVKDLGDCAIFLINGYSYLDPRGMPTNAAVVKANAANWNGVKF